MSKVAIVTGASSGIGKACALALLADGWQVVLVGRRADALEAAAQAAGAHAVNAWAVSCDVSHEDEVAKLFDSVRTKYGRVDLLFNNAGIFLPASTPGDLSGADWRRSVDVNFNGAFYCLSHAFKLINNGSISAHAPRPGSIAYTATKHAITGMTKAASLDGRAFDIAVGQIDIGNVASDMTEKFAAGAVQADGSVKPEARMDMQGVVDSFMAMARLPLTANVLFMTVMATKMPFVGRG
jgi:NAD(P)-dependent dehydrogenase (short-subunit alcohol dehydrogenase family)